MQVAQQQGVAEEEGHHVGDERAACGEVSHMNSERMNVQHLITHALLP